MSDDQAAELDDRPHSPATDPHATTAAGDRPDNWYPTGAPPVRQVSEWTPEERAHNRAVYGVTYSELHPREHAVCVTFCLTPGQRRRGPRCPSCYGKVDVRAIGEADIEPCPTRAERFAAWAGGWVAAFCEALLFPFRVGRAHTEAMVRDILNEALAAAVTDILAALEGPETGE